MFLNLPYPSYKHRAFTFFVNSGKLSSIHLSTFKIQQKTSNVFVDEHLAHHAHNDIF